MSLNDKDEATLLIDELLNDVKTLDTISKHLIIDKTAKGQNRSSEIAHQKSSSPSFDNDLYKYLCPTDNDNFANLPNFCKEKLEENRQTFKTRKSVFERLKKMENDVTYKCINEQDILTKAPNLMSDSDSKPNAESIIVDIIQTTLDFPEKITDEELENDDISASDSVRRNLKKDMTTDLEDNFAHKNTENGKIDSNKEDESGKIAEVPNVTENIPEISTETPEEYLEKSDENSDIFVILDSEVPNDSSEQTNDYPTMPTNEVLKNSAKILYFTEDHDGLCDKNDPEIQDKNDVKIEKVSSSSTCLETPNECSKGNLKRLDEKIQSIGFHELKNRDASNADENFKQPNSLVDVCCKYFNDNYIKEEIGYRWGTGEGFIGNECSPINSEKIFPGSEFESKDIRENLIENAYELVTNGEEKQEKQDFISNDVLNNNFVDRNRKVRDLYRKRKYKEFLGENFRHLNKSFFSDYENPAIKRRKDGLQADIKEMQDYGNSDIRDERERLVISIYRDICLTIESIFIKPFANVLADSWEFFLFVCFLNVCLFNSLYKRMKSLILNYILLNVEKPSNNLSDENQKSSMVNSEMPVSQTTTSETYISTESKSFVGEHTLPILPFEENEVIEQLKDANSSIEVRPEDILIISSDHEPSREYARSLYEKGEDFTSVCKTEQHRVEIRTFESLEVKLRSNNEKERSEFAQNENYFDTDDVTLSKELRCDVNEANSQCDYDELNNVEKLMEECASDSERKPLIKSEANNSFSGITARNFYPDKMSPLNSTQIEEVESRVNTKCRSFSHFITFSASDICYSEEDSNAQVTSKILRNRKLLSSSLSVNLPSFCSMSEYFNDSNSSAVSSNDFRKKRSKKLIHHSKILKKFDNEIQNVHSSSYNLIEFPIQNSQYIAVNEKQETFSREEDDTKSTESYSTENSKYPSTKNLVTNLHMEMQSSYGFEISNIDGLENSSAFESSSRCGDGKFSEPSNESGFSTKIETADKGDRHNRKKKERLGRRMSQIFNNWRKLSVVQCIMKNPKSKKRDKNGETIEN